MASTNEIGGGEQGTVKLTGNKKEICTVPEIRTNFIALMVLLSVSSFGLFFFNF